MANVIQDYEAETAKLKIYSLGRFQVFQGDVKLTPDHGRSKKIWELMMYLLSHNGKTATTEVIAEALQTGEDYANPNGAVKNLVHRLRQKLNHSPSPGPGAMVIQSQGCYGWNPYCDYWLDAEAFENLCKEANALAAVDHQPAFEKYSQALSLYKGKYMPECTYTEWIHPARQYYRQLFVKSMCEALSMLKEAGNYQKMIELCDEHLYKERFEEEPHLYYLEALIYEGKISQARSHYEYVSDLFYRELGVKPSREMKRFYRIIKERSEQPGKQSPDLQEVLQEAAKTEGAFYCEVDYFRHLCQVERRRVERENRPVHAGLLTLEAKDDRGSSQVKLKETMAEVRRVLETHLRKGDVFSPWNEHQFAMLLPGATQEQAEVVLERAGKKIREVYLPDELVLKSRVYPIVSFDSL